jgi:hypothetical protein
MNQMFAAFEDELQKIAEERQPVNQDRLRRAARLTLGGSLAFGLGAGLGGVAGRLVAPKLQSSISPRTLAAIAGALGGMGATGLYAAQQRASEYMNEGRKAQDQK